MAGVLRWEDPPPSGNRGQQGPRRSEHWQKVAGQLRENPGRWAVVLEDSFNGAGGIANQIKKGSIVAFRPSGTFEAQTRTVPGEIFAVYARYIGEAS